MTATMIRTILNLFIIMFLFGCGTNSSSKKEINNSQSDSIALETDKSESEKFKIVKTDNKIEFPQNKISDTLNYYQKQKTNIPPDLYKDIFNYELSDIDNAYLKEIKMPIDSLIPIIVAFTTVESDREKEYVDLHIFNYSWTLLKSLSIEYEMHWDLFRQEYRFLNDSIFEIYKYEGLSYENDSTVKTTLKIKLDRIRILDTLNIHVDTLKY